MIYLFTALYSEASVFIKRFHLTKNQTRTKFQEFYNEEAGIRLTVTGVGEIAAAAAVSNVCSTYRPTEKDLLFNVGTCARTDDGGIFLCNKITELATGKTFYPDLLYRHDFEEAEILTGMCPLDHDGDEKRSLICPDGTLYDMEAAAVYQAGSYDFGPHQMIFLKLVSDRGNAKGTSREQIEQLMEVYADRLYSFVEQLSHISSGQAKSADGCSEQMDMRTDKLCADLHCSKVMGDLLRQYIRYCALSGVDVEAVVSDMYADKKLPCKDKKEGKQRFEELKRRLFE